MRCDAVLAVVWVCAACATTHPTLATTPAQPLVQPPAAMQPPVVAATLAPGPPSFNVSDAPVADAPVTPRGAYTVDIDHPPPAFYRLSARERERWHACHVLFLGRQGEGRPEAQDPRRGDRILNSLAAPPPAQLHLVFSAHVGDYVVLPNESARRDFLVRNGCPASLVDLADGTHIDMVEGSGATAAP